MALETGTRVGVYEVSEKIGEGGMGEVYRAHDTTLDRDVALKVLPEGFGADADRLARFQREAKVLASLNHTNIGHIYGIEEIDSTHALVLELIEGPTLADRIAEGPIPVDETLDIARQIADALEVAHDQGIIHRDLKPANVKVRPDGTVKVLDFGLAKAVTSTTGEISGSNAPTMSLTGATQMGMVVGTAAYMSPEQAKGKNVSRRTDVWAYGVVLYEMLSGKRAFVGEDVSDTLVAVFRDEPDRAALPKDLSPHVRQTLDICLRKDAKQRISDMSAVRLALDGAFGVAREEPGAVTETPSLQIWQQPMFVAGLVVVSLVIGGLGFGALAGSETVSDGAVTRLPLSLGLDESLSNTGRRAVAVSRNGRYITYSANNQIFLRAMDQMEAEPIRGTDGAGGSRASTFSPDNEWIAFHGDNSLKKVAVTGGAPVTLSAMAAPYGISWDRDDRILVGMGPAGVLEFPAAGGEGEVVIEVEGGEFAQSPQLLPGDEWVLFTLRPDAANTWSESQIVVESLVTKERRVLINGGTDGRYVSTGHIVYVQEGILLAVRFDIEAIEATPGPVPIIENVAMARGTTGVAHYSVSDSGMLVYVSAFDLVTTDLESTLVRVSREGVEESITEIIGNAWYPRYSPDGSRIAFGIADGPGSGGPADLWVLDVQRGTRTRLTFGDNNRFYPVWSPDGTVLAYSEGAGATNRVLQTMADGSGGTETLLDRDERQFPMDWSPDGSALAIYKATAETGRDLYILPLGGDAEPEEFLSTPFEDRGVSFSPNGQWLAYVSAEAGQDEIYVRPYPDPGGEIIVSNGGGQEAVWGPDGAELFYRNGDEVMVVNVQTEGAFSATAPKLLFDGNFALDNAVGGGGNPNYDIAPDGESFVMVVADDPGQGANPIDVPITVVINWFEELTDRVPVD